MAATGARRQAMAAECLSNCRQIGVASSLYVAENDGRFPSNTHAGVTTSWTQTLRAYLGPDFLGRCPAAPTHRAKVSYGWNDLLANPDGTGIPASRSSRLGSTMMVAELGDSQTSDHYHFAGIRGGPARISANQFRALVAVDRHGSGSNYVFADGHAEFLTWTSVRLRITNGSFIIP